MREGVEGELQQIDVSQWEEFERYEDSDSNEDKFEQEPLSKSHA